MSFSVSVRHSYHLTPQDQLEYVLYRRRDKDFWQRLIFFPHNVLLLSLLFLPFWLKPQAPWKESLTLSLIGVTSYLIMAWIWTQKLYEKLLKVAMYRASNGQSTPTLWITLTPEGLTNASSESEKQVPWQEISDIRYSRSAIYLLVKDKGAAFIVPRHSFDSWEAFDDFYHQGKKLFGAAQQQGSKV